MTKSRIALASMAIGLAAPVPAQNLGERPPEREAAEARYRAMFPPVIGKSCAQALAEGEIVVCARRADQIPRLPLPLEPAEGARQPGDVARASGERGGAGTERCSTVGANQQCTRGLTVLKFPQ